MAKPIARLTCKSLNSGGLSSVNYKNPHTGNEYTFFKSGYTDFFNAEDALHFLNCGMGKMFEAETATDKLKKALKSLVSKKKDPEAEKAPEEVIPEDDDMTSEDTKDPEALGEEKKQIAQEVKSKTDVMNLSKKEQTDLIKEIQGNNSKIPTKEADRVKLLLKLQKEGHNLN